MSKHTPGPWCIRKGGPKYSVEGFRQGIPKHVCMVSCYAQTKEEVLENEANARLIENTPRMYEALKQQRRQLLLIAENCEGFANSTCGYSIELIDAVLAKVEEE